MTEEIIKTGLLAPAIIPDILESGILGMEENSNVEKLKTVYQTYLNTKRMPSKSILNAEFGIDMDDINPADTEWVYQKLREHNQSLFDLAVRDLAELIYPDYMITPSKIQELEKKHIKDYGSKEESSFQISSLEDIKKLREMLKQQEENFLQTGFKSINDLTKSEDNTGGWHPGAIYTVVGLSGYGKSTFLANFARDMWEQNRNVLYVSTEMDHGKSLDKIIRSKYKALNMDEAVLKAQSQTVPSSHIRVIKVHPNDTTCDDIQRLIDALDWSPDILLVDYADELKSHESTNNEYESQGVVYAGLKKLAEVNNLPVLTATQTNRAAEDSEKGGTKNYVGYNAVADSSKKIRLVDMLFSITQSLTEKAEGLIHLSAVKNRFGESQKKITFSINYQTMRIEELPPQKTAIDSSHTSPQSPSAPQAVPESKPLSVVLNRRGKI